MDWDEHIMLISHTVNLFRDHILVIGNTGSNSTKEALHATEQGFAVGMHASLQINPYYGKTSMSGSNYAFTRGPACVTICVSSHIYPKERLVLLCHKFRHDFCRRILLAPQT